MGDLLQQAQPILTILQGVAVALFLVFMLYMRSVFVPRAEHNAVVDRVQNLETAQKLIDDRLKSGPTAKDVHELQLGMTQLSGKLDVANERMSGVEDLQEMIKRQVQVMDEWMRDHK